MDYIANDSMKMVAIDLEGTPSDNRRLLAEICVWATWRRIVVSPIRDTTERKSVERPPLDEEEARVAQLLELILAQSPHQNA